jgi:hypothetical protein
LQAKEDFLVSFCELILFLLLKREGFILAQALHIVCCQKDKVMVF